MKTSTITQKLKTIASILFWIAVWYIASIIIGKEVVLPSPKVVIFRLFELCSEVSFYKSILFSMLRICAGFILGTLIGLAIGVLSYISNGIKTLLSPILTVVKTTPVASFIILSLMFMEKSSTVIFISVLIVIPIIAGNTLSALENTNRELYEVCKIYNIKGKSRIKLLYLPSLFEYFLAGFKSSFGLSWKSGIAAEVLCTPSFSIGKNLYESKIYLETADVFAWTLCVIVLSLLLEKVILLAVDKRRKKS